MKIVTYDIETITPNWTPKLENPNEFPPIAYHKPIAIVCIVIETSPFTISLQLHKNMPFSESVEVEILKNLLETLKDRLHISFNGRCFDAPLLAFRAMKHAVKWNFHYQKRHRYPNYKTSLQHYDVCDQMSDYGACRKPTLDECCMLLGLPGKYANDGASVSQMYSESRYDDILRYCAEDTLQTLLIACRQADVFGEPFCLVDMEKVIIEWSLTKRIFEKFHEVLKK